MKTLGRIIYGLIRIGIMLLPLVILLMGIGFLRRCLQALASPSVGLDFTYEARKGSVLHITAESYSFLWQQGVLQVVNPRLQDAGGQLLAQADSARIVGLKVNYDGPIDATVRNLNGKLVRLANGHFALEDYFHFLETAPSMTIPSSTSTTRTPNSLRLSNRRKRSTLVVRPPKNPTWRSSERWSRL